MDVVESRQTATVPWWASRTEKCAFRWRQSGCCDSDRCPAGVADSAGWDMTIVISRGDSRHYWLRHQNARLLT